MRKIINSTYITLDGAVANPQDWPRFVYGGDRSERVQADLLEVCDAILMGRGTYEAMAPVWPTHTDPLAEHMNGYTKYVVSSTLTDPEWNNTTVVDIDALAGLKQMDGRHIVQYGIGPVTRFLLEHELLDELRLWLHPAVVGAADLPFRGVPTTRFELTDVTRLGDGVLVLAYQC